MHQKHDHEYPLELGTGEWDLGWRLKILVISSIIFLGKKKKLEVNIAKCLHMLNMDGGMFVFNPQL